MTKAQKREFDLFKRPNPRLRLIGPVRATPAYERAVKKLNDPNKEVTC